MACGKHCTTGGDALRVTNCGSLLARMPHGTQAFFQTEQLAKMPDKF